MVIPDHIRTISWSHYIVTFIYPEISIEGEEDWIRIRECPIQEEQCNTRLVDAIASYPQFSIPIREVPKLNCPTKQNGMVNTNFWIYRARLNPISQAYIGYRNMDLTYLYWCDIRR